MGISKLLVPILFNIKMSYIITLIELIRHLTLTTALATIKEEFFLHQATQSGD